MNTQLEFEAREGRDRGMILSSEKSGEAWRYYAIDFLERYLRTHETMFTDDLWEAGLEKPESPRALGVVIQFARKRGWMEDIRIDGGILARESVSSHMALNRIWRSRLCRS
jgi:hypothetical protein